MNNKDDLIKQFVELEDDWAEEYFVNQDPNMAEGMWNSVPGYGGKPEKGKENEIPTGARANVMIKLLKID